MSASAVLATFICPRQGLYRVIPTSVGHDLEIWQSHANEWRAVLTLDHACAAELAGALTA